MKTPRLTLAVSLLTLAASIGCEEPKLSTTPVAAPPAAPAEPEKAPPMVAGLPGKELPETDVPVTDIPRKFLANDPVAGRRSRREAREGTNVGGLGTTIAGGFYAQHQMKIHAIDQALALHVPQHNFEYPKTQDEFMKQVVELALNGQPLPKLQEDHEYCYVPSQPERGLQIRLKPGSPKSKVPAGTSAEEAFNMLGGSETPPEGGAAGETPAEDLQKSGGQTESKEAAAPEGAPDGVTAEEQPEPVYDIRSRAAAVGEAAANRSAEEQP